MPIDTPDLVLKMAEAREAVASARLQAELHVTAVLRGTEEKLGAFREASAKQVKKTRAARLSQKATIFSI